MTDTPTMADMIDAADPTPTPANRPELTLPPPADAPRAPTGPTTIAEVRELKKARRVSHRMNLDTTLTEQVGELQERVGEIGRKLKMRTIVRDAVDPETGDPDDLAALRAEIEELTVELAEAEAALQEANTTAEQATVVWRFRALGKKQFQELVTECPASARQQADHRKQMREAGSDGLSRLQWNDEEFHPRLVAACTEFPAMTDDDAREIWADPEWSPGELDAMFTICLNLTQIAS